ncbi:MAG: hypothetical protein L3J57_01655 [Desulfuromusa sp.]|nr:hypothetical protein [Desulfuromusa sp.]
MASNYLEIRNHIKTILTTLGCGKVHGYARLILDWSKYIKAFQDVDGKIRGWEISRKTIREHQDGAFFRYSLFILRGHLGVQDAVASDEEWQVLIDDVCEAFRQPTPPANAIWWYGNGDNPKESPAQVVDNDPRVFGNVLCHYAEIHLTVTERIVPT